MSEDLRERIIKHWGKSFYKENEEFHKKHDGATAIEYDNESKLPVRAIYTFAPYSSFWETEALKLRIMQENSKRDWERGEE